MAKAVSEANLSADVLKKRARNPAAENEPTGRKVNWKKLKTEYVTGNDSYRALAERHGISLHSLSKIASKEGWPKARQQYGDKVATKTTEAMCARACAREVKKLDRLKMAADKLAERIDRVFEDTQQFQRHIVSRTENGTAYAEERVFEKVDTKAIRDLTAAVKDLSLTMRNLYNLPTVQEQSAMDIAAERLLLEQRKAENEGAEADREILVRFEAAESGNGQAEGWSE